MNKKSSKELLWLAHKENLHHGFINFWAGMLEEMVDDIQEEVSMLEFGSTGSEFLRFLSLAYPLKKCRGIILDTDMPLRYDSWILPKVECLYSEEKNLSKVQDKFDFVFSEEVFSLIENIEEHASLIFELLSKNGTYYSTFGWHTNNPCFERQKKLRVNKNLKCYPYNLDKIADVFHQKGFEVGFKKLSLPYFMIYNPNLVNKRFGDISSMIQCLQDYKILFSFRKYE